MRPRNIANISIPIKNHSSPNTRAIIIIVREMLPRNLPRPKFPFFEAAYDCVQEINPSLTTIIINFHDAESLIEWVEKY